MKDFIGKELAFGDKVLYIKTGCREFECGIFSRITKSGRVAIDEFHEKNDQIWARKTSIVRNPNQVIKL